MIRSNLNFDGFGNEPYRTAVCAEWVDGFPERAASSKQSSPSLTKRFADAGHSVLVLVEFRSTV